MARLTQLLTVLIFFGSVVLLALCVSNAAKAANLKQEGYFEVFCDGVKISQHTTYHKAIESSLEASNGNECTIDAPNVLVSMETQIEVEPNSGGLTLMWDTPTTREDGTPLEASEIKGYRLYWSFEEGPVFDSGLLTGNAYDLKPFPGTWRLWLTTVTTDGLESKKTPPLDLDLRQ